MSNSPRRASLVNSSVSALPPIMVDNDAGVREISVPQSNSCIAD